MKYISQTIDFISYKNGEEVKPEKETFEYCFGPIPAEGEVPTRPDSGWNTDMSNPWDEAYLDSDGKRQYHVWRRTRVDWTNEETTYVGYLLLDDYEIATVLANQEGCASVGEWCQKVNKTIIHGATIMSGTVDADRIVVNDLSAFEATIAGWDITENGINKEGVVGMSSGGTSYDSLVNEGNASPIRFYAGGQIDFDVANPIRTETLTFPTDDGKWSRTISLTEEEQQVVVIKEAKCLTTPNVFFITETQPANITTYTSLAGQYYPIVSGQNVTLSFSHTPINDAVTVTSTNSQFLKATYKGGGVVTLSGGTAVPGEQSVVIYYSYNYEEALNVDVEINDDATAVTYTLTPQREDVDYTIDVQYAVSAKKQNFMVLEDGSLYANNAKLSGGDIAGWEISEKSISKGDVLLNTDDSVTYQSLVSDDMSPVRFSAGGEVEVPVYTIVTAESYATDYQGISGVTSTISISCDGELLSVELLEAYAEETEGGMSSLTCSIQNVNLGAKTFEIYVPDYNDYDFDVWTLYVRYKYQYRKLVSTQYHPIFKVLDDGSLYAANASISGKVSATNGDIGGLKIDNGIKGYNGDSQAFSLTSDGLTVNSSTGAIKVGKVNMSYDTANELTYFKTGGPLYIQGGIDENLTSIELMTDTGEDSITFDTKLKVVSNPDKITVRVQIISTEVLYEEKSYTIYCQSARGRVIGEHSYSDNDATESVKTLVIGVGQSESEIVTFDIGNFGVYNCYVRFKCDNGEWLGDEVVSDLVGESFTIESGLSQARSNKNILITGNMIPKQSSVYSIGRSGRLWSTIYAQTTTISQSDKNKKNSIKSLAPKYVDIFDNLKPVSYKFNENTSNRTHIGFIAQDVKDAILDTGLTTQDFGGYCEWKEDDGSVGCGLRYEEFVALCVDQIQKLKKRVEELENKLNTIQND